MPDRNPPSAAHDDISSPETDPRLRATLRIVPRGAFALASLAVALLLLAWIFVYFFVFLPRGPIS